MAGFTVGADRVDCRSWIQYNGTNASIRDDYNVASVTDHAEGQHSVVYTTTMPNDDYCVTNTTGTIDSENASGGMYIHSMTTGYVRTYNTNHADQSKDRKVCCIAIFGA
jgi:hypothetical protein